MTQLSTIRTACHQLLTDLETMPALDALERWPWGWSVSRYRDPPGWEVFLHVPMKGFERGPFDGFRSSLVDAAIAHANRLLAAIDKQPNALEQRRAHLVAELAAIDETISAQIAAIDSAISAQGTPTDHLSEPRNEET